MKKDESTVKRVFSVLISNWQWSISILASLFGPTIAKAIANTSKISWSHTLLSSAIFFLLVTMFFLYRRLKHLPSLTWSYFNCDTECSFYFFDRENILLCRKSRVKALKNGANDIIISYDWSGSSVDSIEVVLLERGGTISNRGYELTFTNRIDAEEGYKLNDMIKITLHHGLRVGETLDYEARFNLTDKNHSMTSHLSLSFLRPYEKARLEVEAPELLIKNAKTRTTLVYSDHDKFEDEAIAVVNKSLPERRCVYTFPIPKKRLKLLYTHKIMWEFV